MPRGMTGWSPMASAMVSDSWDVCVVTGRRKRLGWLSTGSGCRMERELEEQEKEEWEEHRVIAEKLKHRDECGIKNRKWQT